MAGSQVATPAVGASDWTDWITQQGLTDRGFMSLTLTNMSVSAACQIAGGSIAEIAGSIFNFATAETIDASTWTAIATASDVYVKLVTSGTSVLAEFTTTAPTWRDDYQGFYGSAASVERWIGGLYKTGTSTYDNKFLYSRGDQLSRLLQLGKTRPILNYEFEIGEWNMDATNTVSIAHNSVFGDILKVRKIDAMIKDDTETSLYPIDAFDAFEVGGSSEGIPQGGINSIDSSNIVLYRTAGGYFDGTTFNATASTVSNRGWIFVDYEA
jgi:hypothetical protein